MNIQEKNEIWNEYILEKVKLARTKEKMIETRQRCFIASRGSSEKD